MSAESTRNAPWFDVSSPNATFDGRVELTSAKTDAVSNWFEVPNDFPFAQAKARERRTRLKECGISLTNLSGRKARHLAIDCGLNVRGMCGPHDAARVGLPQFLACVVS